MNTLGYFLTLTGCALATYLTRMPALALSGRFRLPVRMMRLVNYVGPAVLAALIAPGIFAPGGTLELNPLINYCLPAAAVTVVVSLIIKNSLFAILSGMATIFLFSLIL